jgi:hypothetical protein
VLDTPADPSAAVNAPFILPELASTAYEPFDNWIELDPSVKYPAAVELPFIACNG